MEDTSPNQGQQMEIDDSRKTIDEPETVETSKNSSSKDENEDNNDIDVDGEEGSTKDNAARDEEAVEKWFTADAMFGEKERITKKKQSQKKKKRYDKLLRESSQWIRDMESSRNDMYRMSLQNNVVLDMLAMQGLD